MRHRLTLAAAVALAGVIALAAAGTGGTASAGVCGGWGTLAPSPLQRSEVGAARIGSSIYVVGGFLAATGKTTNRLARYDIDTDEWELRAPMPIAVNHPGVTSLDGRLYVLGGFNTTNGLRNPVDRLYRYTPSTDRWDRLPDAPTERAAHGLAAHHGKLFAVGGRNDRTDTMRSLQIFNVSAGRWHGGPPMGVGRNHLAVAFSDGKLYAFGGRPGPVNGGLRVVERYNPERERWRRMPSLAVARSGIAAATLADGRIVVFGGEELGGGSTIGEVELFTPRTRRWSALPDMCTPRHGLGGVARGQRVYALEGGPMPGFHFSSANEFLDVP